MNLYMVIDDAYKDQLGKRLTLRLSTALEKGEIPISDLPKISGYILSRLQTITYEDELAVFFRRLTEQWPIFSGFHADFSDTDESSARQRMENIAQKTP